MLLSMGPVLFRLEWAIDLTQRGIVKFRARVRVWGDDLV